MAKEDIKKEQKKNNSTPLLLKGGAETVNNIRKRVDGRWEWRKQINSIRYQLIDRNRKKLEMKAREFMRRIENKDEPVSKLRFIDLAWDWFNLYKKDIKSSSKYKIYLTNRFDNHPLFKEKISLIKYEELQKWLSSIEQHRVASYCYFIIKGVYEEALKRNYIKRDISQFLTKPKNKTIKGENFTYREQELILKYLDTTPIKNEILFYLLTGARRSEGLNLRYVDINFEKLNIFINGTKSKSARRYVPISPTFAEILKNNFDKMFKHKEHYYNSMFKKYLESIGIEGKTLHSLRHTYNTNLYYLGVPDKERQYYMGHTTIVVTNDIYTHLDPTLKKEDILNLYKDLYPWT